jgi:hypothetical protein
VLAVEESNGGFDFRLRFRVSRLTGGTWKGIPSSGETCPRYVPLRCEAWR